MSESQANYLPVSVETGLFTVNCHGNKWEVDLMLRRGKTRSEDMRLWERIVYGPADRTYCGLEERKKDDHWNKQLEES